MTTVTVVFHRQPKGKPLEYEFFLEGEKMNAAKSVKLDWAVNQLLRALLCPGCDIRVEEPQ